MTGAGDGPGQFAAPGHSVAHAVLADGDSFNFHDPGNFGHMTTRVLGLCVLINMDGPDTGRPAVPAGWRVWDTGESCCWDRASCWSRA